MSFIEKDFYHEPPKPDAKPEEWETWLGREKKARAAHKAQYTKAQEIDTEAYESMFPQTGMPLKINGVYKQQGAFIGFAGNKETNTLSIEMVQRETQEHELTLRNMEQNRNQRGNKSRAKEARRRANRKARLLNRK
jgi:hypothetical protein